MFRQPGRNGPASESDKSFASQRLEQGDTWGGRWSAVVIWQAGGLPHVFFENKRMGLRNAIKGFFNVLIKGRGHGVEELARRLGKTVEELRAFQPAYREFVIPKRSGGTRRILAPAEELKALQRCILWRLLGKLKCHSAVTGFARGQSIVTNARRHVGKPVVVRMDLRDFFPSTKEKRVRRYFRKIGWNREAARILVRLCTHEGGLPQGASTSPRLSNLINYRLDARLTALADSRRLRNPRTGALAEPMAIGGTYSRYADDLTFSFIVDDPSTIRYVIHMTKHIVRDEGYELHMRKKLFIRRRHACQQVTGLVVNEHINLPRKTRRWLRSIEHRLRIGRSATLTREQLAGWRALQG